MCVAPKSGPGREYSIAVDRRDCAWSPPIVVRNPEPATPRHLEIKPSSIYSAAADEINAKTQRK